MAVVRAVVSIPAVSQVAEDTVVNNWHFFTPGQSSAELASLTAALKAFYESIVSLYPSGVNLPSAVVTYYDALAPKPRPPLEEQPLGSTPVPAGTSGPTETAICLSFFGTRESGLNPARRRNRIYLGPLDGTLQVSPQVPTPTINSIITAANQMLAFSQSNAWSWVTWSRALEEAPTPPFVPYKEVAGGWVDNAWDTQRRRGQDATARTTFGAPAQLMRPTIETLPA